MHVEPDSPSWWQRLTPDATPRRRLLCFPFAGGGPAAFRLWPRDLPPDLDLVALQLPGRQSRSRESPYQSIEPLLTDLAPSLPLYPDCPAAFFGHSAGAVMAFALACALTERGTELPGRLFMAGHKPPHLGDDPADQWHRLDDATLVERLKEIGGTPQAVFENAELLKLFLPVLRADLAIVEQYSPRPGIKITCPITALAGDRDPHATPELMERWSELTTADFTLHVVRGDHFFPFTNWPAVRDIITTFA